MSMLAAMIGAAAGSAAPKLYVDDVFSAYTYTGTGSALTINNGIDLAGKGGMVWFKSRGSAVNHHLLDTVRGVQQYLKSNTTDASASNGTRTDGLTAFNSNGFSVGVDTGYGTYNTSGVSYMSWAFRKAPKFFDVVQFTTNSSGIGAFNHSLGGAPGMIIVKAIGNTSGWAVYHQSLGGDFYMSLNTTSASSNIVNIWAVSPTSVTFNQGLASQTYVAYLFAHDASADGLIQCGSYSSTGDSTVTLGWEPQLVLTKISNTTGNWTIWDVQRGMPVSATSVTLYPNTSGAEASTAAQGVTPTATGFNDKWHGAGNTVIYMAIRRPNKPPTSGTQVYSAATYTGDDTVNRSISTGLAYSDISYVAARTSGSGVSRIFYDRLRGNNKRLSTSATDAEANDAATDGLSFSNGTNCLVSASGTTTTNWSGATYVLQTFKRAPGVLDVVCYTGVSGANNQRVPHSLGVTPELIIVKSRNGSGTMWGVYHAAYPSDFLDLHITSAKGSGSSSGHNIWGTAPATHSATTFGTDTWWTGATLMDNYVAYLFASLPGVSKVGNYTGNGSSQTINCGFAAGARFILIKRADGAGDWYVWDSVRGIVSANDPHLSLNTTVAEVTTDDSVDPDASGFVVNQNATTNININAASYIYLAIA